MLLPAFIYDFFFSLGPHEEETFVLSSVGLFFRPRRPVWELIGWMFSLVLPFFRKHGSRSKNTGG